MTEIIPNSFGADIEEETSVQINSENNAIRDIEMSVHGQRKTGEK